MNVLEELVAEEEICLTEQGRMMHLIWEHVNRERMASGTEERSGN